MSNSLKDDKIIIINKKVKKVEGGHGGAWKVAYADFVTAMMALFIVLWVMSQGEEVKNKVAEYFKDPAGISVNKGAGFLPGEKSSPFETKILDEFLLKERQKELMQQMEKEIEEKLSEDTQLNEIRDQVQIEFIDEGMRIELLESDKDVFFEVGTSVLNSKAKYLLRIIGEKLAKLNNDIVIEGHTDSRPYQNGLLGYTNFELSADRANSARRILIESGLSEKHIAEIRGYADKKLRNPDEPFDATNRRISIIVKYKN